MKISSFMVGVTVAALFTAVFGSFYAGIADSYSVPLDENTSSDLAVYNQLQNIQDVTNDINKTLFSTDSSGGVTDIVGLFLGSGFNVLKIAKGSLTSFYVILTQAVSVIPGLDGVFGSVFVTVALILLLFAIISVLVGRDV